MTGRQERAAPDDLHEWLSFEDPDEARTWLCDVTFLLSRWTCIYGRGCQGILTEPAPELERGCCSYGAHFTDDADRARVEAAAEALTPEQWQLAKVGTRKGIAVRQQDGAWRTRVHDGACIMLNRPGFAGGAGCALHRAALEEDRPPLETKPDVCWQLPIRRVDSTDDEGHVTSTIREWKRRDWGDGGAEFHWWCTAAPDAFVGDHTVVRSMQDELAELMGAKAFECLLDALAQRGSSAALAHPAVRRRGSGTRR